MILQFGKSKINIDKIYTEIEKEYYDFIDSPFTDYDMQNHDIKGKILLFKTHGQDKYRIISGGKNYLEHIKNKKEKITVYKLNRVIKKKQILLIGKSKKIYIKNVFVIGRIFEFLINVLNYNQKSIGRYLKVSQPMISNYLTVSKLPNELKNKLNKNDVSLNAIKTLYQIINHNEDTEYDNLFRYLLKNKDFRFKEKVGILEFLVRFHFRQFKLFKDNVTVVQRYDVKKELLKLWYEVLMNIYHQNNKKIDNTIEFEKRLKEMLLNISDLFD